MTFTHALSTNNYGCAKFIVDASAANGTHTTIAAAITAASSGDTIFIRPGTYTENLTLKAGVSLTGYGCNSFGSGVIITGKCSFTAAGVIGFSGIVFTTNNDFAISITGSANSQMLFTDCSIVSTNHTAIEFNTSGAAASILFQSCQFDISTTGIAYYTMTAGNNMHFTSCFLNNSGASTTASTVAAGAVLFQACDCFGVISSSGTSSFGAFSCNLDTSAVNTTTLTIGGSSSNVISNSYIAAGTATAVSAGGTVALLNCVINTSNTNAIAGAGTLTYAGLSFPGTAKINTTTQTGGLLNGGVKQAPSAGYIGEQITNSATSVATVNSTAKTVTSISLTAGIWDVSSICSATATGGTALMTVHAAGIGTTDNTLTGTQGVDYSEIAVAAGAAMSVCSSQVPQIRATLTSTTTYYLVVFNGFSSTTCPTNGRITATRVG
jgi:hypothetical protein